MAIYVIIGVLVFLGLAYVGLFGKSNEVHRQRSLLRENTKLLRVALKNVWTEFDGLPKEKVANRDEIQSELTRISGVLAAVTAGVVPSLEEDDTDLDGDAQSEEAVKLRALSAAVDKALDDVNVLRRRIAKIKHVFDHEKGNCGCKH